MELNSVMKRRPIVAATFAAAATLVTTACSSTTEIHADFPGYDRESLISSATMIAEGTVTSTQPFLMLPQFRGGDDPETNPYSEMSEEEKREAMEAAEGIPATASTFRIDVVFHGDAKPGDELTIFQTGGDVDGQSLRVEGVELLASDEDYLLFLTDAHSFGIYDGVFNILGGAAGSYRVIGDGEYAAMNVDLAPFNELTVEELESLTE